MFKYYYILPIAIVLVSCGGNHTDEPTPVDPDPVVETQYAMTFSAHSETESRDAASDAMAEKLGNNFLIFAKKTNADGSTEFAFAKDEAGTKPYVVTYTPLHGWDYTSPADQYLKYWDLSAKHYTFYAIANYPGSKADGISISYSYNGIVNINNIDASDPNAANLMDSRYMRISSIEGDYANDYDIWKYPDLWKNPSVAEDPSNSSTANNPTANNPIANIPVYYRPTSHDGAPAIADDVPLPFHYLLSQVQFKVYNKAPQYGPTIPISHATIKIYDSTGYYTTGNCINSVFDYTGKDQSYVFVDTDLTDTYIFSSKNNATTIYSGYVLPQSLAVEAYVILTTDNGTITGKVELTGWERSKIYTYYLHTEITENYILVDEVKIDDWIPGASIDKTQDNW